MKVLLRNVQTGLFYVDEDQWTGEHQQAHDFENPDLALNAVDSASLAGVEVVCHFEDPLFDLPLTIHRRRRRIGSVRSGPGQTVRSGAGIDQTGNFLLFHINHRDLPA
jgi:hypothetical protein